ncbi:MAG: alpha/beta hydrolase [Steroidobacteraceae bacterium]
MSAAIISATAGLPLPSYVRLVDVRGGSFKRWLLHSSLRVTAKRIPITGVDAPRLRHRQERFDRRFGKAQPAMRATPVDAGGVAAEWLEVPGSRPDRVLLYFHGGAFLFRFPRIHTGLVGRWCRDLGARALMVDYRLAPEHPFPAASDDCFAAYRWLLASGVRPADIVIGGDSAGGNLALGTLHRIKAAALPLPRCALLLSPVVDFTMSSPSLVMNARRDPMFTLRALTAMRGLYASPQEYLNPAVSPLFGDFTGLPPMLFQVGSEELLLDEAVRAAARAHASGVDVELTIWKRMAHVFQALPVPQAAPANQQIVDFIQRHAGWRA